jgi:hypothetical protein
MTKNLLKILFLFICLLSTGTESHTSLNPTSEQNFSQKQERWLAMEKEVMSLTDGLGKSIDPDIKNTVIILNLLGFKTSASCQGHLDWGLPYPWIDFNIENQEVKNLMKKAENIQSRINQKRTELGGFNNEDPDLINLFKEMRTIGDEIEKKILSQLISLKKLLEEFYTVRSANPDRMIVIHQLNPTFLRLQSVGGNWRSIRDDTEKAIKLKEYQAEMRELTSFLREKYYNQDSKIMRIQNELYTFFLWIQRKIYLIFFKLRLP